MARRRGIDDDVSVLTRAVQLAQFKQRHHFIQSWQRKTQQLVDVVFVEQGPSLRDLRKHVAVCRTKPLERKTRVHLVRNQPYTAKLFHFNKPVTDLYIETVR